MYEIIKKNKKKTNCYALDSDIIKKIEYYSDISGVSRSKVVGNIIGMFGNLYEKLIELNEEYNALPVEERDAISFDNYLIQKGYRFLVEGKCKK